MSFEKAPSDWPPLSFTNCVHLSVLRRCLFQWCSPLRYRHGSIVPDSEPRKSNEVKFIDLKVSKKHRIIEHEERPLRWVAPRILAKSSARASIHGLCWIWPHLRHPSINTSAHTQNSHRCRFGFCLRQLVNKKTSMINGKARRMNSVKPKLTCVTRLVIAAKSRLLEIKC